MLFVSIPMSVCAYQEADWSVDVRPQAAHYIDI